MTSPAGPKPDLKLAPRLATLVEQDYPRFSAGEMTRRRRLMADAMAKAGVEHLVAYASLFRGGPVQWLTGWLATTEAVLVFSPERADVIFVQFYNHLPQAREVMPDVDFRWGGESTPRSVAGELRERGASAKRIGAVGAVGALPMNYYRELTQDFGNVVDFNRVHTELRLVKSGEELDWYRLGARFSDLAVEALQRTLRPGLDEGELGAAMEAAFLPWRGAKGIHYLGATSMHDPQGFVPRQHLTSRRIAAGDVVACEISANFWDHSGQVLRTFCVGEPLTPRYRDLHSVAEEAFAAILSRVRPASHVRELAVGRDIIEKAGFTFYDDLVHGYGGGYLPPIIGSPTRQNGALPDMVLQEGMMLVIQPNVIATDGVKAGVQTGELVVVTESGAQSLHRFRRGPIQV
jgi:Xaa-Pro dipeptidase